MQNEFQANHPDLQIQLLGVNAAGLERGNANATNGRDLPFLQDVDDNDDGDSDVWTSWEATWRDVTVVDAAGDVVETYNLTLNDLRNPDNYDELKQIIIDATTPSPILGDCNGDGAVEAADLACVSDIQQRDEVLDALNTLPGDLDGNGEVAFADFLVLSSNFGQDLPGYADGNVDLKDGVGFADFLVLSSNFGQTLEAAPALEASADASFIDAVISDWQPGEDD